MQSTDGIRSAAMTQDQAPTLRSLHHLMWKLQSISVAQLAG
jgi:hypothetical protein